MSRSTVSIAIRNNRTFLLLLVPTAGFCCLTSDYPQIMIRWCFKDQVILTILSVLIRWIPSFWSLPIKKTAQVSLTVENQTNQSWLMDVKGTVFENHRKSLIQHCERSEQRFFRTWTSTLWTLIPPKSNISWFFNFLILGELGFKWDFLYDFQTLCPKRSELRLHFEWKEVN